MANTQSHTSQYEDIIQQLLEKPKKWLITGVAGFIGSNLLETLLKLDQLVVGLDNLSTGYKFNLDDVKNNVSDEQWARFTFIKDDIRNLKACKEACNRVNYILHQAALCSVEQSIHDPVLTSTNNINGFLNMIVAAHDTGVNRFIYASSCAIYGDCEELPLDECKKGNFLSPYAADKYINELHGDLFSRIYKI
ncbi:MAG: GDP-mannose 4,6-dehydratase, partial [Desulfobacterales bacterium]|nr:GDP-mannose 4,6-dehydratase [Desulfobacterales bacterium]